MIAVERFLTAILLFDLLTTYIGVGGSRENCPSAAVVNLTGHTLDYSGFDKETGASFRRNAMWVENGTTFGCPCDLKPCIQFCCPEGYALSEDGCVKDSFSDLLSNVEHYFDDVYAFADDPCNLTSTDYASQGKYYWLDQDNIIVGFPNGKRLGLGKYCLVRGANSNIYYIGVCDISRFSSYVIWVISCMSIAMLLAAATFVVYSVTPKLKNLQGSIFRCYLVSYISCMLLFTVYKILSESLPLYSVSFAITAFVLYYFGITCMLWLNVMSFDIWQKFWKFLSNQDVNTKKLHRAKFIRYSIYAWGAAAVPPTIMLIITFVPKRRSPYSMMTMYLALSPFLCIPICNTCLFILTAFKIKQRKKETAHMVDGVNKHQKENEQWFNLYVKLFIIMGGPMIIWAVAFYCPNDILHKFALTLEVLQTASIFLIFVWKDDVKRSLGERFDGMLRSLSSFLRRDSASSTEN